MAIPSFFHPGLNNRESTIELEPSEASHAVKARRLRVGDTVRIFNGNGLSANGVLQSIERRAVTLELHEFEMHSRPEQAISVAVAIPKGDRQKVLIDNLTQLGLFEIIPLRCDRSVTKTSKNTLEKWQRVAIEACKQSQNPWLPKVLGERSLDELLSESERSLYYADACGEPISDVKKTVSTSSLVTIIVGPEGGFTLQEFTKLEQNSISSFKLGPYILRTEAAAIAAVAAFIS